MSLTDLIAHARIAAYAAVCADAAYAVPRAAHVEQLIRLIEGNEK